MRMRVPMLALVSLVCALVAWCAPLLPVCVHARVANGNFTATPANNPGGNQYANSIVVNRAGTIAYTSVSSYLLRVDLITGETVRIATVSACTPPPPPPA